MKSADENNKSEIKNWIGKIKTNQFVRNYGFF